MSKSKERDAQLERNIAANEAKLSKYKTVRNSISSHGLSTMQDYSKINERIEKCQEVIDKLDGNAGYGYASNLKTKMETNLKTLKKYRDFVEDSNTSMVALYETLEEKISSLEELIAADKAEYNEGRNILEAFVPFDGKVGYYIN